MHYLHYELLLLLLSLPLLLLQFELKLSVMNLKIIKYLFSIFNFKLFYKIYWKEKKKR